MTRSFPCPGTGGVLCILVAGLFCFSCTPTPEAAISSEITTPEASKPLPAVTAALAAEAKNKPLRLALVLDRSGSMHDHLITPFAEQHLASLLDLVSVHGGEVAIALVCDDSNQPLLRFKTPQPPQLMGEAFNNPPEPPPPDENTINALQRPEARRSYETARARYEELKAEDEQRLQTFEEALAAHQNEAQTAAEVFLKSITPALEEPPACMETDLHGALHRQALFFSEETTFEPSSRRVLIVVSDGLDTIGNPPADFGEQPELILVNGSGSEGVFKDSSHKAFESLDAAIAFLVHSQN